MRILFDARYIRTDFHDGISRYSQGLGAALHRLLPLTFIIHDEAQREHLPGGADVIRIHPPTSAREAWTARILNAHQPDLVFSPMQTMGTRGRTFKVILTLHDTIYYRNRTPPSGMPAHIRAGWWLFHVTPWPQRWLLNAADLVATVSHTSKAEIQRMRLTKRAVIVVPNAAPEHTAPQTSTAIPGPIPGLSAAPSAAPSAGPSSSAIPAETAAPSAAPSAPRNLVYMGSFMRYKHVETLIAAMAALPGYRLHLLSKIQPARRRQLERFAAKHAPAAEIWFHGGVSDATYFELLRDRAILVTASSDEGYGLPVAEALTHGTPAVVSDIPIFHEVAGAGALYAPWNSPLRFAEQIRRLDDDALRAALVAAGQQHMRQYSWEQSARHLRDAIEGMLR